MTRREMAERGWDELDILFISGDAYIDHPAFGVPLLARFLENAGFRVGIIAQPDWRSRDAFKVLGRPRLFAAISSGAMDSMVNHYTAAGKLRRDDAYTPGGRAGARPNRALITYTASVKGAFKGLPVVIGGIEGSLRRLAHYDYWDDRVRRSILVDTKADLLVHGMGEKSLLTIAKRLQSGESVSDLTDIPGTARLETTEPQGAVVLPSFDEVAADKAKYSTAFRLAAEQSNPLCGKPLAQKHGARFVIVNPPAEPLSEMEMDRLYALPFNRLPHPAYKEDIPASRQILFSVTTHRGCFGGCAFCAITHHQGKTIQSRSEQSVLDEIDRIAAHPDFKGTLSDIGGPTANMYGLQCGSKEAARHCRRPGCLMPRPCRHLVTSDRRLVRMLERVRRHSLVRHAYVASGIRYDLLEHQRDYFDALVSHHVGGLLKVAPETTAPGVAAIMRKPGPGVFEDFLRRFWDSCRQKGLKRAVVPYFIASHPGSTVSDMVDVALFLKRHRMRVEQVQEFTPTPGTLSTCLYHTGIDPFTGKEVHVPRSAKERRLQKALLLSHRSSSRKDVREALRLCGREEEGRVLLREEEGEKVQRHAPRRRKRKPAGK
ncbi:MAG: YgiQ family radical SAM protein [Desulfuromonadales bacterium]